jgi:phospholipase C
MARCVGTVLATLVMVVAGGVSAPQAGAQSPIQHVVLIYLENNSFDDLLGRMCVQDSRCDGATSGKLYNGQTIALSTAPDIPPIVSHSTKAHRLAVDGGKMDGFSRISGCNQTQNYQCYEQYNPSQVPNLVALARKFALSDRTFEWKDGVPSFGSHVELGAAQLDGFVGDNPPKQTGTTGKGWGCDSSVDAYWQATPTSTPVLEPACIPKPDGSGPYRSSPVPWVPSLMDHLDAAGVSWQFDAPTASQNAYGWSVCPTFADCLYTSQANNMHPTKSILTQAQSGTLANVSIVIPCCGDSEHNGESMALGDTWLGSVVNALMNGPEWSSTAIFITYDDFGGFYDHVPPPGGTFGMRVPMVIVSPYAKPGYTDSSVASIASVQAYIEHTFGVQPLTSADGKAYDFLNAFNYSQTPLGPARMVHRRISHGERLWLARHPLSRREYADS